MKIAFILNSTAHNGGATKAFLNMLDGFSSYDIAPYVVVPDKNGVFAELNRRNIPTLVLTYRPSAYPSSNTLSQCLLFIPRLAARIFFNHKATHSLTVWLEENGIDIVHSNTGVVRIGFDAAQKTGLPHIYHIREYADLIGYPYFPTRNSFVNQLNNANSYSICITKAVQSHYRQDGNEGQSRVIYDGVFHMSTVMPVTTDKHYFLFAGRIQPAKGVDTLLEAYSIYATRNPRPLPLFLAGSPGDAVYMRKLTSFIKEHNLSKHVAFLGDRDDILTLMRNARALVVSSTFEGFGFCMPEAMQQGCLVIGRNTSGTKEQFDNGVRMIGEDIGLRYNTCEELASLLMEVSICPPEKYQPYRERAFRVVNTLYTQENNVQEITKFYQDIIRK